MDSFKRIKKPSKTDAIIVNATVMEPTETGEYHPCPHPLQPGLNWSVSSIISEEKLSAVLVKGTLFEAAYEMQRDKRHLHNLIKFDLETYKDIQLTEKQIQWLKILGKIDRYINLAEDVKEEDDRPTHPWEPEKAVDTLQTLIYHKSEDDLIYDERVIENLLRAIQTNTMVVLSGPSGTGKSSIVSEFAHAIKNAKATFVPVQSGWTDTQDLLGYFNPMDQCFVPTPFMEALADAANDLENLHIICLDEMNLSHVEYYFSEFLSSRENKSSSIRLYSKRYFDIAEKRISSDQVDPESEEFLNAADLVNRYPYKFDIPPNVPFIGTMNMDHTVKSLSPKVIDRSFIIEIDHLDKKQKGQIEKKVQENVLTGCIVVNVETLSRFFTVENAFEKETQEIIDLSQQLDIIANAPLNSWGRKQIAAYLDRIPEQKMTKK
ncbi:McrB family protein [Domibacillus antri]|uniref:McrB family protein n=1 Tax=Domibacillus antri TaxID=1714264 RepID=UPI0013011E21|nr:AAA family ATPase [Domibacillus antri]